MANRTQRIERLKEYFSGDHTYSGAGSGDRYAAVTQRGHDGDYILSGFNSEREAMDSLGDDVLEGMTPIAVFDLDTGERIEVHIATPVVTRSEDQAIMENPLDTEESA